MFCHDFQLFALTDGGQWSWLGVGRLHGLCGRLCDGGAGAGGASLRSREVSRLGQLLLLVIVLVAVTGAGMSSVSGTSF